MSITTLSNQTFRQDVEQARQAANNGPVFITEQGRPVHVLLTIEEYQRLRGKISIVDLLAMSETEILDFEPPRLTGGLYRAAELS